MVHESLITNFDYSAWPSIIYKRAQHSANPALYPHPLRERFSQEEFAHNLSSRTVHILSDKREALKKALICSIKYEFGENLYTRICPVYELSFKCRVSTKYLANMEFKRIYLGSRTIELSMCGMIFIRFMMMFMVHHQPKLGGLRRRVLDLASKQTQIAEYNKINKPSNNESQDPVETSKIDQQN